MICVMRHESSTIVALVGDVTSGLLSGLARSPNISVVQLTGPADAAAKPAADSPAGAPRGWQDGALAMREAARRRSTYVIVAHDPLAAVAAGWASMWDLPAGLAGPAGFEAAAGGALAAWRARQFELPDYYLAAAAIRAGEVPPDFYLGPLRGARPRRVAVAGVSGAPGDVGRVLDELRSLEHGPWWPPLEDVVGAARNFFAGGLAEAQPVP
jgi:hypothetical protein